MVARAYVPPQSPESTEQRNSPRASEAPRLRAGVPPARTRRRSMGGEQLRVRPVAHDAGERGEGLQAAGADGQRGERRGGDEGTGGKGHRAEQDDQASKGLQEGDERLIHDSETSARAPAGGCYPSS